MCQRGSNQAFAAVGLLVAALAPAPVPAQTRAPMVLERPKAPASPELVVLFQGGDYVANIPRILRALAEKGAVATETVELRPGETVCDVYERALSTKCVKETEALAQALNRDRIRRDLKADSLQVGQEVVVPVVQLTDRPYSVKLDPRVGSDRSRIADLKANWKEAKQQKTPDGYVGYTFTGFELRMSVETDKDAIALRQYLRELRIPNVTVDARLISPPPPVLHTSVPPDTLWQDCLSAQGSLPKDEEGDLRLLLSATPPRKCPVTCTGNLCPDVVLVDTTVWRHPELSGYLDLPSEPCAGPTPPQQVAGTPPPPDCRTLPFDEKLHHGTHLAGIVSSKVDGRGVSGIAPGTLITSVCWPTDAPSLITFMSARQAQGGQTPIYLFASEFPWNGPLPTTDDERFSKNSNPFGAAIRTMRDLWVVAAGDGGQQFRQISFQSTISPADLGDQENVLVVTACDNCFGTNPSLTPSANRSTSTQPLVHVAAPGGLVASTCTRSEYGLGEGTSQAAAFVAGAAAAMKACYPDSYREPWLLKTRLQTTSNPFPSKQDGITAGIVDLDAALLDPKSDWIRIVGQAWTPVHVRRWPTVLEMPSERFALRMNDIYRLRRIGPDRWVAYTRYPSDQDLEHRGEVVRFGPGRLVAPGGPGDANSIVALELCDDTTVRLANLDDVLLTTAFSLQRGDSCPR